MGQAKVGSGQRGSNRGEPTVSPTAYGNSLSPLVYQFDDKYYDRWVITDRDGTINVDPGYVHKVTDLEFVSGSVEALSRMNEMGWGVAIATNQSGLARGYFTTDEMELFNACLIERLRAAGCSVSAIAVCPHLEGGSVPALNISCECRKPKPGLLIALKEICALDPRRTVFIGDKDTDAEAAKALGIAFLHASDAHTWNHVLRSLGDVP